MKTNIKLDTLSYRKATLDDLPKIIEMIVEDDMARTRDSQSAEYINQYKNAFGHIDKDENHFLMVVVLEKEVIGTCHLVIIPSLTYMGSTRMQIESVRITEKFRSNHIGQWMIEQAISYGKSKGASIMQLMTNKNRIRAANFYTKLGFEASHDGFKLILNN